MEFMASADPARAAASAAPAGAGAAASADSGATPPETIVVSCKWSGRSYEEALPPHASVLDLKRRLEAATSVPAARQKLAGLRCAAAGAAVVDGTRLGELKAKPAARAGGGGGAAAGLACILMGQPDAALAAAAEAERAALAAAVVFDDFELDAACFSDAWRGAIEASATLERFVASTEVRFVAPPRARKPLLVLDLDHTLLDFTSAREGGASVAQIKRPHMDAFLAAV